MMSYEMMETLGASLEDLFKEAGITEKEVNAANHLAETLKKRRENWTAQGIDEALIETLAECFSRGYWEEFYRWNE